MVKEELFVFFKKAEGKFFFYKNQKSLGCPLCYFSVKHRRGMKRFPVRDSLLSVNLLQAGHFLLKPAEAKFLGFRRPIDMSVLNITQSILLQFF